MHFNKCFGVRNRRFNFQTIANDAFFFEKLFNLALFKLRYFLHVEIGKQLLITRGALTTFSIANDVAKYFAIIPAMLVGTFPQIAALNIMQLKSPMSAILSAVIFNALIIIALIPLALKGVRFRPLGAARILQRNLLIYGLGGIILPFPGIKLIDIIITTLHLA